MEPLRDFAEFEKYLASFTNYERQRRFRYGPEALPLGRMLGFAKDLGAPHRRYPAVHIAGTKGKGSTTLILERLLIEEGFRVGSYTSPHVDHLRERVQVDGEWVSEWEVVDMVNSILPVLERRRRSPDGEFPTFFELMTGLAMLHFSRRSVDWGLFEVGLGGRLDATNILSPRVTAITNIALEHTQVLGDTLEKIAREKAGVIKDGTPVVVGALASEALEPITEVASQRGAPLVPCRSDGVRLSGPGLLEIDGFPGGFRAPAIRGPALRANLALALEIERLVLEDAEREPSSAAVSRALFRLELPARVELFGGNPPVVLDGAHTAESVRALGDTLAELDFPRPRTAVFSLAGDKRMDAVLEELLSVADDFIFTRADAARSLPPDELRTRLGRGRVVEEPGRAVEEALEGCAAVVICGSIYLAGEVRGELMRRRVHGAPSTAKP
ncbi:MAG: hypothetical protein O7J95_12080 [Planctomycetota bacterium]|nr:hypothetical protein [Planctomycetota bacterium]